MEHQTSSAGKWGLSLLEGFWSTLDPVCTQQTIYPRFFEIAGWFLNIDLGWLGFHLILLLGKFEAAFEWWLFKHWSVCLGCILLKNCCWIEFGKWFTSIVVSWKVFKHWGYDGNISKCFSIPTVGEEILNWH